jgi:hypothetical protein
MSHKYRSQIAEIDYYKELFVSSFDPSEIKKAGKDILKGKLNLGNKNLSIREYNRRISDFDWEIAAEEHSNSFSLYLLGLRHIYILSFTADITRDLKYLKLAEEFLFSFYNYLTKDGKHNMLFNDHALAERIENLVYFSNISMKLGYKIRSETIIENIIHDSIHRLFDPKVYQRNHNHGIIADKACLIGLYFLNDKDSDSNIEFVLRRLKDQIEYSFGTDGVHKENSFDYHISTLKLLLSCYQICKKIKKPFYLVIEETINKAIDFIIYGIKPDGTRPLFGDSKSISNKSRPQFRSPFTDSLFQDNPQYQFVSSFGESGKPPKENAIFFPSGYIFLREHFNKKDYVNSTYLSFKAGYTSRIHKHQDDLSFTLFSKGKDIFVDSGMCGYMPKDKIKDYMESMSAHNTIGVKNRAYSIATGNGEKFRILSFEKKRQYDYIKAYSKVFDGITIYRHIYYFRNKDLFIIRDELYSDKIETFIQYFNLSNDVTLSKYGNDECIIDIEESNHSVFLNQLRETDSVSLTSGIQENGISVNSTGFGSYETSSSLTFTAEGKKTELITAINIQDNTKKRPSISLEDNRLRIDNTLIPLEKTTPVKFKGVDISIKNGNELLIENIQNINKNRKFALYVFDSEKKTILKKLAYTHDKTLKFKNKNNNNLLLLYYISSIEGEVLKGIIGEVKYQEGGMEISKIYSDLHFPKVEPLPVHINQNKHTYSLNINYDYPVSISWWVYYNGGCTEFEINDNRIMTYNFEKTGEYVVMCSVKDKFFGESFFYQFDKTIIN